MTQPSGPDAPFATRMDRDLVGRDELLRSLVSSAEHAVHGVGSLTLLTGEAGIGKTSVARALARFARDEMTVSWGLSAANRSAPAFWPWRDLLDDDLLIESPEVEESVFGAVGGQRHELLRKLRQHVVARARRRPLLHIIEDLQWADVASMLLLVEMATAVIDAPLMVVATLRTDEPIPRPLDEVIEDVRRSARVMAVPALSEANIASLLESAGIGEDPELPTLVKSRTGGNPFLVTELLRWVTADRGRGQFREVLAGGVPERVSEQVQHRLSRLPGRVAATVAMAAIIGAEGDTRTLAAALGTDAAATVELLEQARAARLLDAAVPGRWMFAHDLVRDAVYRNLGDAERARSHAAALESLEADAATPAPVLAHHALSAQPLLDATRAVALVTRAGQVAMAHHAYEEAIGWFEQASKVLPLDAATHQRAEIQVLCGEACRQAGEIERARAAFLEAARTTSDPGLLTRAALGYADPGADLGIAFRTDDLMTTALHDRAIAAQPQAESVTTVLLEARLASLLYFSDDPSRARELARSALDRAQRLGDVRALVAANAVTHDAFVVGQADLDRQLRGSEQLVAWALESGSSANLLAAHRARVIDLLAAGDMASLDREVAAFRRVAAPLRSPGYQWWIDIWSAMRSLLHGRLDTAETQAVDAFGVGERSFPSLAMMNFSFLLFFLRREQGRFAEMEGPTREYVAAYPDVPALSVGLAFLLAELGRLDEARVRVAAIVDELGLERLHDRNWPAAWFQLARVAYLLDDPNLAGLLLQQPNRPTERCVMVSVATVCLGAKDLAEAWLRHTIGDFDEADARYRSAARINARIEARSWLAQTRADHARLLLDRDGSGDGEEARGLSESAAATAVEIGLRSIEPLLGSLRERLATAENERDLPVAPATGRSARRPGRPSGAPGSCGSSTSPVDWSGHPIRVASSISSTCSAGQDRPFRRWSSWASLPAPKPRPEVPRCSMNGPDGRSALGSRNSTPRSTRPRSAATARWLPSLENNGNCWPRPWPASWGSAVGRVGSVIRLNGPARRCRPGSGARSQSSAVIIPSSDDTSSVPSTPGPGARIAPKTQSIGSPDDSSRRDATRAVAPFFVRATIRVATDKEATLRDARRSQAPGSHPATHG